MNIGYIIGLVIAIVVMVLGMANGFPPYDFNQLKTSETAPAL